MDGNDAQSAVRPASDFMTMGTRWRAWALCWLLAVGSGAGPVAAQQPAASGAQVRAAYLHKFPGFVEWPAEAFSGPAAPIVIAVIGEDEVYAELSRLAPGRTVQGRPVEVLRLALRASLPKNVHVLYVGAGTLRSGSEVLDALRRRGVLTVSDSDNGSPAGTALCFVEEDGRIRFDAWPTAAEQTGLKLSASLLAVARRVAPSTP